MAQAPTFLSLTHHRENVLSQIYALFAEMLPDDAPFWTRLSAAKSQRVTLMSSLVQKDENGTMTCTIGHDDLTTFNTFVVELTTLVDLLKTKPQGITKVLALQMALFFEHSAFEQSKIQLTFIDDALLSKALKAISYEIEVGISTISQVAENFYVFYKMAPKSLDEYLNIIDPKRAKLTAGTKNAVETTATIEQAGLAQSTEITSTEKGKALEGEVNSEDAEEETFSFSPPSSMDAFFVEDFGLSKKNDEEDEETVADIIASAGRSPRSPDSSSKTTELLNQNEALQAKIAQYHRENEELKSKYEELQNSINETAVSELSTKSTDGEVLRLQTELAKVLEENKHLKIELENVMTAFANLTADA